MLTRRNALLAPIGLAAAPKLKKLAQTKGGTTWYVVHEPGMKPLRWLRKEPGKISVTILREGRLEKVYITIGFSDGLP